MSLVTRCPACGTSFKVVEDQLRVSAGWVRCGRCTEVFNALEGLFDNAAAEPPAASGAVNQVRAELVRHAPPPPSPPDEEAALQPVQRDGQPLPAPAPAPPPPVPAPAIVPAAWTGTPRSAKDTAPEPEAASSTPAGPEPSAGFLRRAERAARWQRPGVRLALGLAALALLALLGAQGALLQRDWLAARWPAARPALTALCEVAGCRIEPLRSITQLAVESSGLTRVEGGNALYRLQVVLRNTAELPLALPAIELSLTDAQGQLVTRRVVRAQEMGAREPTLGPGQELPLATLLAGGERRLAGYSIDLFYP